MTQNNVCIGMFCDNTENLISENFAGRTTSSFTKFPFPERVEHFKLPGNDKDFLCKQCASTYAIQCKVHGCVTCGQTQKWPPICSACQREFQSISEGTLIGSFTWIVPLTRIELCDKKPLQEGFLARSQDGILHVFHKKTRLEYFLEQDVHRDVESVQGAIGFTVKYKNAIRCIIGLDDPNILYRCYGLWQDCWKPSLGRSLGLNRDAAYIWLVTLDHETVVGEGSPAPSRKIPLAFVYIDKEADVIRTFPPVSLPELKYKTFITEENTTGRHRLILGFNVNGIPHKLTLISVYPLQSYPIDSPSIQSATPNESILTTMRQVNAREIGETGDVPYLLTAKYNNTIQTQRLPDGPTQEFSHGFEYNNRFLLISKNGEALNTSGSQYFMKKAGIAQPTVFNVSADNVLAFLFDLEKSEAAHTLWIGSESLSIDKGEVIPLESISRISGEAAHNGLYRLRMDLPGSDGPEPLVLIGPEAYVIECKRILDTRQIKARFKTMKSLDLYREYHQLKKYNQLAILFGDIVLLDQELNDEPPVETLHKKLSNMSVEAFYENKPLQQQTIQKILLFSMFLPEFKKKFEYFSSMYPYLVYENEANFLKTSFGADVAQRILPGERQKIVQTNRQSVRQVQSHIQRSLAEIERAIAPVEELFIREELRKTWLSRIGRHLPVAGQFLLAGGSLLAGGPVGMLAGILAIRAMGDTLNHIQMDKESAGRIKIAAEKIFPWWRVFKDTLTVSIYETSEFIDQENRRCLLRDTKILQALPDSRREKAQQQRDEQLQNGIVAEKENRYVKILKESDVRFEQIEADLRSTVDNTMQENVKGFIATIPYFTKT
ncbi:hypothetical protein [Desulfosudis oleivorans]|uniref:Uncharacterized protein n=1 Tax=Desulfosudis oleivorans (strain DSM 6200 / JCM 39069 / Hxd3) TaxID=96561 RepID=A8ZYL4_DESOH|nr:hypothetical protein [Desulfosudis oleivorans]ABW68739.1 hypothetical protein Dole_2936 [Desulfosudis oleivorans Hxd3]